MNIKLKTDEQLSTTVANGLAGVFINGVSLSASLSSKADLTAFQNYYVKSETSSANEISTALENAGKVYFDNHISGVAGSNDLSVVKLSADEYAQMLEDGECLSNAIYIVEAPNIDAFKQQIKNVANPTDLSDAATKGYVDSNFQPSGNYLTAVPDAYKTYAATLSSLSSTYSLTSHNHSDYVLTSRTVAGQALTADVTAADISSAINLSSYLPLTGESGTDIDVNSVTAKTISVVDSTGELTAAALSCDNEGHGLLVLDGIAFDGATLSATFEANQILEEIA